MFKKLFKLINKIDELERRIDELEMSNKRLKQLISDSLSIVLTRR